MTCIWMFVYAMNFELPEMAKKWSFELFRPNLLQLGLLELFQSYFLYKGNFRVISMIKIVILDQSKPILLYLKIKNPKFLNIHLLFTKTEITQVYNPFYNRILHLLCSIIFFVGLSVKMLFNGGGQGEWGNCPNFVLEV